MPIFLFYEEVSVSDTNSVVTINPPASEVTIVHDGADAVFFTLNGSPATTSDAKIKSSEQIAFVELRLGRIEEVNLICDSGETATVRVYARP